MYSNEKNPGVNWKDIIIKVVFVFLFVLLLMWLFKKSTPNMTPFYSNVFRENIKYMQDAAESYYTNERLPKNIGDTAEITLGEMIRKNMILEFVDKDGNECDKEASYVQVVKNKNDYTLKVNLVCPTEKNFVEKTLGCYDYCEDCDKEEKVTEYQFKQATSKTNVSYTCPSGGTLKDGVCYVYGNSSYKATEVTSASEYYCPNGGTLKNGKCYVTKEESHAATETTKTGVYYCKDGDILDGKICRTSNNSTYTAYTRTIYEGGYYCPEGGELWGSKCYVTDSYNDVKTATYNYSCPSGYTLSGTKCVKKVTNNGNNYNATKTTGKSTTYNASFGKTYKKGQFQTKPAGYTCSTGKQYICTSSSNCPGYVTVYTGCYKKTYSCPQGGTLNGTKCTISGKTTYSCPYGGTLNGTICKVAGSTSTVSVDANRDYSCPSGYSLSGTKCYKKIYNEYSYKATWEDEETERYCNSGDTLKVNTCYTTKETTYNAYITKGETVYTCSAGEKLNGKLCYKTVTSSYNASKKTGTKTLSCPSGGTLDSKTSTCNSSVLKSKYNATKVSKVSNGYIYKWSTSETLEGWERTGATRQVAKTK